MIEITSNPMRFVGIAYAPTPVWAQRADYTLRPFIQLSLYFVKVDIHLPFKHNAKLQFGSKSERYSIVFNFKGYFNFEFGKL